MRKKTRRSSKVKFSRRGARTRRKSMGRRRSFDPQQYNKGFDQGYDEAFNEGYNVGYAEGVEQGRQQMNQQPA